jgi:hypothetical protein
VKRIFLALPLLVCVGCAYMHSTTIRALDPTTGIITETTQAKAYALFDANSSVMKFRNQSGYSGGTNGGFAPGTYMVGLNESSSTSNLVQIIQAVATGVVNGMK